MATFTPQNLTITLNMKQLLLLTFALVCSVVSAQEHDHMSFMGIKMGVPVTEFVDLIKEKRPDLKFVSVNDSSATIHGKFYKIDECNIYVKSDSTGNVNSVQVSTTSSYLYRYELASLKQAYDGKYGEGVIIDGSVQVKVRWITDGGLIQSSTLKKLDYTTIDYFDYQKAIEILQNDIDKQNSENDDL